MDWKTRLLHSATAAPGGFRSLATPVWRGSTVVFESLADAHEHWQAETAGYAYGLFGTPTVLELAARIAELEGARHTFLTPSGMAAIALVYLSCCKAGDHVLLPWTAYGPNHALKGHLGRLGIEVETYDPMLGGKISERIRGNTSLIWAESPGSITMEIQDVPAIVAAAHAQGVPVALDNTYAAGVLFDAFAAGVDISIQALTKYAGGHSDVLMGSVSVRDETWLQRVGSTRHMFGMGVSPDDASLVLRGLQTLALRLERFGQSALKLAQWVKRQPGVRHVLHPALADCRGHDIWKRDFRGSASLFSVVFVPSVSAGQVREFADALQWFAAGYSWGGTRSLLMTYPGRRDLVERYGGQVLRLNIGLEDSDDLIADLAGAWPRLGV